MKKLLLLLICISLSHLYLKAQVTEARTPISTISAETITGLPHAKGKLQFLAAIPMVMYRSTDTKFNGVDGAEQSNLGLDLRTDYFFAKGLAGGVNFMYDLSKVEVINSESTTSDWSLGLDFTYQRQLSQSVNFFVRAGPMFGGIKEKDTYLGNTHSSKANIFGGRVEVGFPLELTQNGTVSFVPSLSYRYRKIDWKDEEYQETDSKYGVNFRMITNLLCGEMRCDAKTKYTLSAGMYDQGHSYIGMTTRGMVSGGSTTYKDDNPLIPENEEDYFNAKLGFEYMYYFINNLAGGIQLNYRSNTTKADPDYEFKTNSWSINPTLELNLPVKNRWFNNTYIRASYEFGGSKNEESSGSLTNTEKYKVNGWSAGVGHNFFINKNVSLSPMIAYESQTVENKEEAANQEWEYNGIYFGAGLKLHF